MLYPSFAGMADANNISLPVKDALKDILRIRYHYGHLYYNVKLKLFDFWLTSSCCAIQACEISQFYTSLF